MRWGVLALGAAVLLTCGTADRAEGQAASAAADAPKENTAPSAAPSNAKPVKKSKKSPDAGEPTPTPRSKKPKEIQFPLSEGVSANRLRIPETSLTGELLQQLMALRATRIDNEHVQMSEMNLDLYHPDGKEDFHITMPTSVFNLSTRIITSDEPVTVRSQDFELTGEKMEFNTVDRTGKLMGKVRMLIHNLKQIAGQGGQTGQAGQADANNKTE